MPRTGTGRLNEDRIRATYVLYQHGYSLQEIANKIWEKYGYTSADDCARLLRFYYKARHLPLRTHSEAMYLYHARKRGGIHVRDRTTTNV